MVDALQCPHCAAPVFSLSNDGTRLLVVRTALTLHKSGDVEISCPKCRNGVLLPLATSGKIELRKGHVARPIVFVAKQRA
jgi:hypothetical protein